MRAILLDTHSWVWSFADETRLSRAARTSIEQAQAVLVSPISFFEIGQRVRRGKWPEMEPLVDRLPAVLEEQRSAVVALDPRICMTAGTMRWAHRDPFDRLLAATAICRNLPIVSADEVFDGIVTRVW
jgi:PIN domain nuclease of toxin-antitoxin system